MYLFYKKLTHPRGIGTFPMPRILKIKKKESDKNE